MKTYYWLAIACVIIALADLDNFFVATSLWIKILAVVFFLWMVFGAIDNFRKGLRKK